MIVAVVVVLIVIYNPLNFGKSRQEKFLINQGYKVNNMFCGSDLGITNTGYVEMETHGDRENQVSAGFIALNTYCPGADDFSVLIVEPTRECY